MSFYGSGRRFSVRAVLAVLCLFLIFQEKVSFAGEADKGKKPPLDQIDQIVALLAPPPEFQSARDLFVHYGLMVKSAMVSRESDQNTIMVRIDFFIPVPAHCHPSEKQSEQYSLEEAIWTKSENSDSFLPVNRWARHISKNESDWFQNLSCYP